MDDAPVRVAIYTRVSTDIQANREEGSLDTQEARLRASITAREGNHEIVEVFREEGASGKNLDRPALQRMLKRIRKGQIDLVIVTRIDRLSRSLLDFFQMHQLFEKHQVKFKSLREQFDTSSPVGRAMLKLMLVFAELEREQTAERTRIAMRARAERGLWNGGPLMLGYDSAGAGKLEVNEEEAKLVRLIFDKYIELRSSVKLMRWLNENGYRQKRWVTNDGTVTGGKTWVTQNLRSVLRHKVYLGLVTHTGETFVGQHEPIIELETWERVQKILDDNIQKSSQPRPYAHYEFPFVSMLRCECGYAMTSTSAGGRKGRYFYYECVGHQKARNHKCALKRVRAEALDEAALEAVRAAVADPTVLDEAAAEAREVNEQFLEPLHKQIASFKVELNRVKKEGEKLLMTLMERDLLDNEFARGKLDELNQRKKQIQASLRETESEVADREAESMNAEVVREALSAFDAWEHLGGGERRELLRAAVHEVRVHKDHIELAFYDHTVRRNELRKRRRKNAAQKSVNPCAEISGRGCRSSGRWGQREPGRRRVLRLEAPLNQVKRQRALRRERRPRPTGPVKTVLHRAEELDQTMRERGWTQAQLAAHLGVSRAAVCQALRPLQLDSKVQQAIRVRASLGARVPGRLVKQLLRLSVAEALEVLRA